MSPSSSAAPLPVAPLAPPQPPSRAVRLARLASERFDLLVIGGGASGAGVARDAALRGLKVALVEAEDFASGTSSRSSRLIHGGLRYLEHGHLRLVREATLERRVLSQLAPHLVRPLGFTWPIYQGARVGRLKLTAGLFLYDALSLFRNFEGWRSLGREATLEAEPGLRTDALAGGARYFDAATDDARLTLANALGALEAGACVVNHARVEALHVEEGRAAGARVVDVLGGAPLDVRARVVVSAAGPWTDDIRRLEAGAEGGAGGQGVRGSKGVHLSVPRARLGNVGALTLLSPRDGRVMFILPAGAHAIIGTTETATRAKPSEVRASEADVAYLLDSANHFFPGAHLTREDVVSAWAGIRPLVAEGYGKQGGAGAASREHAVHEGPHGVLALSGGKLTTYRVMARDTVDRVERALGHAPTPSPTQALPLPGGDGYREPEQLARAKAAGVPEASALHLVHAYGTRWEAVWATCCALPGGTEPLVAGLPYLAGECAWAARAELAQSLSDVLVRRLKVAFETRDAGRAAARAALPFVAGALGWDAREGARALERYDADAARLFGVDAAEGY